MPNFIAQMLPADHSDRVGRTGDYVGLAGVSGLIGPESGQPKRVKSEPPWS